MKDHQYSRWKMYCTQLLVLGTCLLSHPYVHRAEARTNQPVEADYLVRSLPGAPEAQPAISHAGYVEVDRASHASLFFWHFQSESEADRRRRTVIWLNGGPGCSSMNGALMETGPYRIQVDGSLHRNNGSWNEHANLLFVDNPVGTGFSYVDDDGYVRELEPMAKHFVRFLEKWFAVFPEYEQNDIYLAGESYAGQHIPYIARAIQDRNREMRSVETKNRKNGNNGQTKKTPWTLGGLLIGNGWISPLEQNLAILPYAYENHLVRPGSPQAAPLEAQQDACIRALRSEGGAHRVETGECEQILREIFRVTRNNDSSSNGNGNDGGDGGSECINMYDLRLRDAYPSCGANFPPGGLLDAATAYLRRGDVLAALHVDRERTEPWTQCTPAVGASFKANHSRPSVELLPGLLEGTRSNKDPKTGSGGEEAEEDDEEQQRVPVVLYSGERDLICNHRGTEELIRNLEWGGARGFELDGRRPDDNSDDSDGSSSGRSSIVRWEVDGQLAGTYQSARHLTYVLFYNASHMVPYDQPRRSRDMLHRLFGLETTFATAAAAAVDDDGTETQSGSSSSSSKPLFAPGELGGDGDSGVKGDDESAHYHHHHPPAPEPNPLLLLLPPLSAVVGGKADFDSAVAAELGSYRARVAARRRRVRLLSELVSAILMAATCTYLLCLLFRVCGGRLLCMRGRPWWQRRQVARSMVAIEDDADGDEGLGEDGGGGVMKASLLSASEGRDVSDGLDNGGSSGEGDDLEKQSFGTYA